jgi:hypothetical protein
MAEKAPATAGAFRDPAGGHASTAPQLWPFIDWIAGRFAS